MLRKKCFEVIDSEVEKKNAEFKGYSQNPNSLLTTPGRRPSTASGQTSGSDYASCSSAPLPSLGNTPPPSSSSPNSAPLPTMSGSPQSSSSSPQSSSYGSGSGFSSLFGRPKKVIDLESSGRAFGVTVVCSSIKLSLISLDSSTMFEVVQGREGRA